MQKQYSTHRKLQINKPNARGASSQCRPLLYYHSHIDICILINDTIAIILLLSSLQQDFSSDWKLQEVPSHFSVLFFDYFISLYPNPAIVTHTAYSPCHLVPCLSLSVMWYCYFMGCLLISINYHVSCLIALRCTKRAKVIVSISCKLSDEDTRIIQQDKL